MPSVCMRSWSVLRACRPPCGVWLVSTGLFAPLSTNLAVAGKLQDFCFPKSPLLSPSFWNSSTPCGKIFKAENSPPPLLNQNMAVPARRTSLFITNEVIHLFFHCWSALPGLPTGPGCLHVASLMGRDLSGYSNSVLSAKSMYFLAQAYVC